MAKKDFNANQRLFSVIYKHFRLYCNKCPNVLQELFTASFPSGGGGDAIQGLDLP